MIVAAAPETTRDGFEALRARLRAQLAGQREQQFGRVNPTWIEYAEDYFWDESQQEFRIEDLRRFGFQPGQAKVLDLAAGCGQFLLRALHHGYDCLGLEPEAWKVDFVNQKMRLREMPPEYEGRMITGVGEHLPFVDDSFDCVTSYQTLEHVQDPRRVIAEMVRVTRPGGGIHLRCPDYRSTFEAHYQLPWLPLMPRPLARAYLRLLGRPAEGLDGIRYVTRPRILGWLRELEHADVRLVIFDDNRIRFENNLRRRGVPCLPGSYTLWRVLNYVYCLFRRESSVNIFIRVMAKKR
ncbi:MAG: methyltransferase domain-containing protein [Burkholderiales bacterium]|nr:methyltransferase domain-containing protein [Burkholderiales bacterium]